MDKTTAEIACSALDKGTWVRVDLDGYYVVGAFHSLRPDVVTGFTCLGIIQRGENVVSMLPLVSIRNIGNV